LKAEEQKVFNQNRAIIGKLYGAKTRLQNSQCHHARFHNLAARREERAQSEGVRKNSHVVKVRNKTCILKRLRGILNAKYSEEVTREDAASLTETETETESTPNVAEMMLCV
jgi:hypothetical protein